MSRSRVSAFTSVNDELFGSSSYKDSPRSQSTRGSIDRNSQETPLRKQHPLEDSSSYSKFDENDLRNTDVNYTANIRSGVVLLYS